MKEPFDDNTEGKRIAAKGLVNLTSNKSKRYWIMVRGAEDESGIGARRYGEVAVP